MIYFLCLLFRNPTTRTTKNAVGMVAKTRKTSLSFFARANAVKIPNIPTNMKYHPYPCIMFSIVFFEVLLCSVGRIVPQGDTLRPIRLTLKYFPAGRRYPGS